MLLVNQLATCWCVKSVDFWISETEAQIQTGQLMSFDDVFDVLSLCRFLVEYVKWRDDDDGFLFVFCGLFAQY